MKNVLFIFLPFLFILHGCKNNDEDEEKRRQSQVKQDERGTHTRKSDEDADESSEPSLTRNKKKKKKATNQDATDEDDDASTSPSVSGDADTSDKKKKKQKSETDDEDGRDEPVLDTDEPEVQESDEANEPQPPSSSANRWEEDHTTKWLKTTISNSKIQTTPITNSTKATLQKVAEFAELSYLTASTRSEESSLAGEKHTLTISQFTNWVKQHASKINFHDAAEGLEDFAKRMFDTYDGYSQTNAAGEKGTYYQTNENFSIFII